MSEQKSVLRVVFERELFRDLCVQASQFQYTNAPLNYELIWKRVDEICEALIKRNEQEERL